MKRITAILCIFALVFLAGCEEEVPTSQESATGQETQQAEGAGIEQDLPAQTKTCPESCDDSDQCTEDTCSAQTEFECQNTVIEGCCGNEVCEPGETGISCSLDCPVCETDKGCMISEFNYDTKVCEEKAMKPCCGNDKCEFGEDYGNCDEDCDETDPTEDDLSDYPGLLSGRIILAIGDKGKGYDTFAASNIGTSLAVKGKTAETLLESQIANLHAQDMIVIGRPCENGIWDEFLGIDSCDSFLEPGTGIIKLVKSSGHNVIFISGDVPENTQKLAEVLAEPQKYDLEGYEITAKISGSTITFD